MNGWEIEATPEFASWFGALEQDVKLDVASKLALLREVGPTLGRPHADTLRGSTYPNLKELRVKRRQIRVLFAFDPRRVGVLLVGGSKSGAERFYDRMIHRGPMRCTHDTCGAWANERGGPTTEDQKPWRLTTNA